MWRQYSENNRLLISRTRLYLKHPEYLPLYLRGKFLYLIAETILSSNPYYSDLQASPHDILYNLNNLESESFALNSKRKAYLNRISDLLLSVKPLKHSQLEFGRGLKATKMQAGSKQRSRASMRRAATAPSFVSSHETKFSKALS